jgi:6-phosphogluconolactonase/glucosamine-6-phosphate isomerase/deaminase
MSLAAGEHVLWLVSGGSNIATSVAIMAELGRDLPAALPRLTVMLTDERFGPVGHPDSNWQQLSAAGFNFEKVLAIPVLSGLPLEVTIERYGQEIAKNFSEADIIIAQFGIGADGHIAGVLPRSPAVESSALVVGYTADPFIRITLTPTALGQVDVAFALAFGESKKAALANLQNHDASLTAEPCQILKQLPEAYLFTDQS